MRSDRIGARSVLDRALCGGFSCRIWVAIYDALATTVLHPRMSGPRHAGRLRGTPSAGSSGSLPVVVHPKPRTGQRLQAVGRVAEARGVWPGLPAISGRVYTVGSGSGS